MKYTYKTKWLDVGVCVPSSVVKTKTNNNGGFSNQILRSFLALFIQKKCGKIQNKTMHRPRNIPMVSQRIDLKGLDSSLLYMQTNM